MKNAIKKIIKNPTLLLMLVVFLILAAYAISVLFILSWGGITTLKSIDEFDLGNILGLPDPQLSAEQIRLKNYSLAILGFETTIGDESYLSSIFGYIEHPKTYANFWALTFNSIIYAVLGTLVNAFTCMTVAYICAKYRFRFCEFIYSMVVVIMIIPIVGNYPASIAVMKDLGLFNSYLGMIVQRITFTGMYFLVFYAFFQSVPDSFVEAAEIDGASQVSVYLKIILPLAIKIMSTVWLLLFIDAWNNYTVTIMYFPSLPTLSAAITAVANQSIHSNPLLKGQWGTPQKIASCMLITFPLIIIFTIFHNKILGDVSMGGLKE